jgi:hypothetical protein
MVIILCGIALWVYLLRRLRLRGSSHTERKRFALPGQAFSFLHTGRRSRETRKRVEKRLQWQNARMVLNKKHEIVHWPHPALFKARYKGPKDQQTFLPGDWLGVLAANAYKATGGGYCKVSGCNSNVRKPQQDSGVHFHYHQEPRIRETLALNAIGVDANLNFSNLDAALKILLPAIQRQSIRRQAFEQVQSSLSQGLVQHLLPVGPYFASVKALQRELRSDSRYFLLYARLVCLRYEQSPKVAEEEISKVGRDLDLGRKNMPLVADLGSPPIPSTLFAPASQFAMLKCPNFECWHQKTVERHAKNDVFRRKLARRILAAREITGVGSSSGKDTPRGEWSSNLQPDSLQRSHHRTWLSKLRKKTRRKVRNISKRFNPRLSRRQKHEASPPV